MPTKTIFIQTEIFKLFFFGSDLISKLIRRVFPIENSSSILFANNIPTWCKRKSTQKWFKYSKMGDVHKMYAKTSHHDHKKSKSNYEINQ